MPRDHTHRHAITIRSDSLRGPEAAQHGPSLPAEEAPSAPPRQQVIDAYHQGIAVLTHALSMEDPAGE